MSQIETSKQLAIEPDTAAVPAKLVGTDRRTIIANLDLLCTDEKAYIAMAEFNLTFAIVTSLRIAWITSKPVISCGIRIGV